MAEVGVHGADDAGGCNLETGDNRRTRAELAARWMTRTRSSRVNLGNGAGAVRRIVVDDDELQFESVLGAGLEECPRQLRDPAALVVGRHYHCQIGRR